MGGIKNPVRRDLALADLWEAMRQGLDMGPTQDGLLETGDWTFNLEKDCDGTKVPTLLWHGKEDTDVFTSVGEYIAERIRGCRATFFDGETHSMLRRKWQQILTELIAAAKREELEK